MIVLNAKSKFLLTMLVHLKFYVVPQSYFLDLVLSYNVGHICIYKSLSLSAFIFSHISFLHL